MRANEVVFNYKYLTCVFARYDILSRLYENAEIPYRVKGIWYEEHQQNQIMQKVRLYYTLDADIIKA